MQLTRRQLIGSGSLLSVAALTGCAGTLGVARANALPGFYEDVERRTFRFFWETVNRTNGLVPDRWPTPSFCSIAAVGFALTAYPIGVERGWCSRAEARELTLTTLRFFWEAPQGPQATGVSGHRGFFYHVLDMQTGLRFKQVELSSVDTTLLLGGILFAQSYFDRDNPTESRIRDLAERISRSAGPEPS